MSKREKQIKRILSLPNDYTYSECAALLKSFGYKEYNKGKTSGSRVRFCKTDNQRIYIIDLHKPHPGDEMLRAAVKSVVKALMQNGDIVL